MSVNNCAIPKRESVAVSGSGDTSSDGRTSPFRRLGRRRILHTFLVKTLGYADGDALDEAKNLERSVSDAMVDRIDNHLRESTLPKDPVPSTLSRPAGPAETQLTDAEFGRELAVTRVSGDEPAMLAYLAGICLTAGTRLSIRKPRAYSDVTTIQIVGDSREIHLGAVASNAVWVARAAAT